MYKYTRWAIGLCHIPHPSAHSLYKAFLPQTHLRAGRSSPAPPGPAAAAAPAAFFLAAGLARFFCGREASTVVLRLAASAGMPSDSSRSRLRWMLRRAGGGEGGAAR